jgi:hypothetical protein
MKLTSSLLAALCATTVLLHAADATKPKPATYLTEADARAAGPDFDLQGEYADAGLGAQVIALGDSKFRLVLHPGGLPGAGWDKSAKTEIEGALDGTKARFKGGEGKPSAEAAGGLLVGKDGQGKSFKLVKVFRQSPTLGAKPPAGAKVLFDGSDCDAFAGGHFDEQGRKLLAAGTKTKDAFGSFRLHAEFLLPFKPLGRGQDRGNSGVYLQDRYEVQVLDSFGLKGANNECGGIYTKKVPDVNMCLPPLVWQTYDIDYTAAEFDGDKKTRSARVTAKHNGVLIHENFELPGPTGGGKPEGASPGPIQLQGHGNPVFYRNIWVVPTK